MSTILERKVAALERRVSPPAPVPRYVITISAFKALSPMEKVDVYRQLIKGHLIIEEGKDHAPARVAGKAELEAMTPEQKVAEYRRALAEVLER